MPRRKRDTAEAEAAAEAAAAGSNDEEVSGGEDEAEDSGDSSDEADLEMAQADGAEKELQVEFIFTDPAEEDTPYVRSLLAGGSLCTATGADAAGLAATVANQVEVGTMIKADGALFGFLSAVSLQRHRADPSVGRLISLLGSDRVEDGPLRQRLAGLLAPSGGANVGLLLSERMVRSPPIPPQYPNPSPTSASSSRSGWSTRPSSSSRTQ
uniref:Uncharacterized protein n=1 Tax=Emiliania huxleyi TaxID=2903 RepID=A0A7S3W6Q7_EMIHU